MKFLMLLFSLLPFFNNDFNKKELNMKCQYEDVSEIKYEYGNYSIIEHNNKIEILYSDVRIELFNNIYHYKIIHIDDSLVVFYKNNKNDYINVYKFDKGKYSLNSKIKNKLIGSFDVILYNNTYLIVSTISEYEDDIIYSNYLAKAYLEKNNAIIIKLDNNFEIINCNILGGKLNDGFEQIYFDYDNELIYVAGKKDQNSGFDFGNGGNGNKGYVFCEINEDLELEKYLVFNNYITNVEIDEKIRIFTTNEFFLINFNFSVISTLLFDSQSCFGVGMDKSWVAIFMQTEVKFYDYNKNDVVDIYKYQAINDLQKIVIINDYFLLKDGDLIIKAYFYNDLFSDKMFIYDDMQLDYVNTTILGIPNNYKLKSITYEEGYSPSIFGEYDIFFNYEYFSIKSQIKVLERCNITDGYIYPIDYNLFFSGTAFLNGKEIYNNHQITEEGEYELKLIGKDEEKIINFKVYNMDIMFSEEGLKNWDYEVRVNQDLKIDFNYSEGINIKEVIINDQSIDFKNDFDNNKIIISLIHEQVGTYEYLFNKIIYEKNNVLYFKNINYYFKVKAIQEKISLNNTYYNDDDNFIFDINLLNNNDQVRSIKVVSEVISFYIPIRNGQIIIDNTIKNISNLKFYLVYDVLGKLYEEQLLFEIDYDFSKTNIIGEMKLVKNNNQINDIVIKISNDKNLKQIKVDDIVEYQYTGGKTYYLIIYSLIFVSALFLGYKLVKTYKQKKNKNS